MNIFFAHLTQFMYAIGICYECYLLWFQHDAVMTLFAAWLGYLLISYATLLPQSYLLLLKEQLTPNHIGDKKEEHRYDHRPHLNKKFGLTYAEQAKINQMV